MVHTWPLARTLRTTVPGDTGDPMLISWQLAWAGRLLRGGGGDFWTTPAFMGTPDNLAFTDVTLGYAPLTFVSGEGFTGAVVQMNLAVLVAAALAFVGGYVLARVIGARVPGALVAGAALAFAPWRSGQVTHLNVYSIGGIALALGLLVRGHGWSARGGFRRDRVSAGWVLAGWVVAAWQLSLGFATGIVFGYVLGLVVVLLLLGWAVRFGRTTPRGALLAEAVGGAAFALVVWAMSRPYYRVVEQYPEARRDEGWLPVFAPSWRGLLTAPDTNVFWRDHQQGWREGLDWPNETALLPGAVLLVLAVVGLVYSAWSWRLRAGLAAATVVAAVLALGTDAPGEGRYTLLPLYHTLPGWSAMRVSEPPLSLRTVGRTGSLLRRRIVNVEQATGVLPGVQGRGC